MKEKIILRDLERFKGKSPYFAIRYISRKRAIASSTIKYILKKLKEKKIIYCNGKIEITPLGFLLIKQMDLSFSGRIFGSRLEDESSILSESIRKGK